MRMRKNNEDTIEFNPPKEEFEKVLGTCFNVASLKFYYGVSRPQIVSYVWRNYHLTIDELLRVYKAKYNTNAYTSINKGEFEKLLSLGYGVNEVANYFMSSVEEVNYWCKKEYGKRIEVVACMCMMRMRANLRESQMLSAMDGNDKSQIWLAKQLDGQRDPDKASAINKEGTEEESYEDVSSIFEQISKQVSGINNDKDTNN